MHSNITKNKDHIVLCNNQCHHTPFINNQHDLFVQPQLQHVSRIQRKGFSRSKTAKTPTIKPSLFGYLMAKSLTITKKYTKKINNDSRTLFKTNLVDDNTQQDF